MLAPQGLEEAGGRDVQLQPLALQLPTAYKWPFGHRHHLVAWFPRAPMIVAVTSSGIVGTYLNSGHDHSDSDARRVVSCQQRARRRITTTDDA